MNKGKYMKYPLLCKLLEKKYTTEALAEITSGKDLLPFPTNEKRKITETFKDTAKPMLMNGDNLLQAVFYDSGLRNIFKRRYEKEFTNNVSNSTFCNEALNEIKDCLKKTNPNHLGKYHRTLLSLMINVPNLPPSILLNLVEKTDVLQRDVIGKTAFDSACLSMNSTNPVNEAAVIAIYQKANITDVVEYEKKIKREHNESASQIVGPTSYVEGFKKLKELVLSSESKPVVTKTSKSSKK